MRCEYCQVDIDTDFDSEHFDTETDACCIIEEQKEKMTCQECGKETEELIKHKLQMFCQECYDEECGNTSGRNASGGYD